MIDAGAMKQNEKQEYNYTRDAVGKGLRVLEGEINGRTYKAVYPGSTGDARLCRELENSPYLWYNWPLSAG